MGDRTGIQWTDATWNPVTGCTKVSRGCDHCYAEVVAARLQARGIARYADGFAVRWHPELLDLPARWRRPRRIFVNSMGDLFHREVPDAFINQVFDVMESLSERHVFQVLTKRSSLMRDYCRTRYMGSAAPPHIWLGVSVEDCSSAARLRHLRETPAVSRFVSAEPLLESVGGLDFSGIDLVIAGGESGPGARPMEPRWAREILEQCGVERFNFKQHGGTTPKAGGRELDGRVYDLVPALPGGVGLVSASAAAV